MLEKFTVIDLIKTRSNSVATVSGTNIRFNNPTAQELFYPPYVQLLINAKGKQFAIRACKETDPHSIKFSKPEGEQKYQITASVPVAADMIFKMMGWKKDEEKWNVPGIYFAEDSAIVYDCSSAYAPQPKGGWAVKRMREAALSEAEASMDENAEGSEK